MSFQHKEAFCLMWYACKDCGHRERIWNSRDGVTPFGTACPSCGGIMYHVDWQEDIYEPGHKLNLGQKYWVDGTPEEAVRLTEYRFKVFETRGMPTPEDVKKIMLDEARNQTGEWRKGWPMLKGRDPSC